MTAHWFRFVLILSVFLMPLSPAAEEPADSAMPDPGLAAWIEEQEEQVDNSPPGSPEAPIAAPDYFPLQANKIIRWNDQTRYIMVYIEDGSHQPGWDPRDVDAVKAAFTEWERAMHPRFRFLYMPDERGHDVKVSFAPHVDGGEQAGVNATETWGKFISKNNIRISLLHSDNQPYPPVRIHATALHEIGHMLGLKGHSDDPADIMYAREVVSDFHQPRRLTARDISTMKRVYAAKPDYTNPEGYHLSNFKAFQGTQKGRRMSLVWIPVPGLPFPLPLPLPF